MHHKYTQTLLGIILLFILCPLHATTVTYDVTDIEEFTIWFDMDLFENLGVAVAPAGWDPLIIEPDPDIPPAGDDGFYDALALVAGIAPSVSLAGFSVQFDYLGIGTPGDQFFEIINPTTFSTLDDGFTQSAVVPIPAAIWLFGSGLVGLLAPGVLRQT